MTLIQMEKNFWLYYVKQYTVPWRITVDLYNMRTIVESCNKKILSRIMAFTIGRGQ